VISFHVIDSGGAREVDGAEFEVHIRELEDPESPA
jgi:hypothetical protein